MKTILVTKNLCHKRAPLFIYPGSVISILFRSDATLTGSNVGSMAMQISGSDPSFPLVTDSIRTPVKFGGILSVGSPPGDYSGTFYIT